MRFPGTGRVTLYGIPGSHPCAAVAAMLAAKGVAYERVDLPPGLSRLCLRLYGFSAGTVPALRVEDRRVQRSVEIARALDKMWPDPPFFPAEDGARARLDEIERWADGPLQQVARRIVLWTLPRSATAMRAALVGARLRPPVPRRLVIPVGRPLLRLDAALNGVSDEAVRADLAVLPGMLDRVDGWIEDGDLGLDPPAAADFQVAGSVRLLLTVGDLAPLLEGRPSSEHALRLIPSFAGGVPAGVMPAGWLPRR